MGINIPNQLKNPEYRFLRLTPKSKVPIPGVAWKQTKLEYNNTILLNHLEQDGNYGVIGGHGNLCLLDIDDGEISKKLFNELNTFTIKTCGGTNHFYFTITDGQIENSVLKDGAGEVRVNNYYVVGPNCYAIDQKKGHEGTYEIALDKPIREITKEDFNKIIEPYLVTRESSSVGELSVDDFKDAKNNTRSETEMKEVCRLVREGKSKEQIFSHMMAFSKWSTAHIQYKELTYKKALAYVPIIPTKDLVEFKKQFWELWSDDKKDHAFELLVDHFLEMKNIYTIKDDNKLEIWYYEDGIYLPNGACELNEWCKEFFGRYYKTLYVNKIKDSIVAKTYIEQDKFFDNTYPHILPVQNGLLNLLTGELEEFDHNKIFFSKLNIKYNPEAKIDKIETFLRDIMGDDEKTYSTIQEFFGFSLFKEYNIQKAIMLLGHGSNGKSAILNLLGRLIGAASISTLSLDQMNNKGFATAQLFGKMVNICGELKAKTLEDTDVFKQITGGELIGADRKFKSHIYFKNYAKLISSCNKLPKTKDLSDGFFRRWILLDFNNKFIDNKEKYDSMSPEERVVNNIKLGDPEILDKICIPEEMEGLLIWSYQGLLRLLKNGNFTGDESIEDKRNKWMRKSSTFADFAEQYIKKSDDSLFVFKDDVDRQYKQWCELKEISPKEIESTTLQSKIMSDVYKSRILTKSSERGQRRAYMSVVMGGLI